MKVDVQRLRALLAAATPGPWTRDYGNDTGPNDDYYVEWQGAGPVQAHGKNADADADLIAAMRNEIEGLLAIAEASEWIAVSDRTPENADPVLIFWPHAPMETAVFKGEKWWQSDEDAYFIATPTHWRPLPKAPEGLVRVVGEE